MIYRGVDVGATDAYDLTEAAFSRYCFCPCRNDDYNDDLEDHFEADISRLILRGYYNNTFVVIIVTTFYYYFFSIITNEQNIVCMCRGRGVLLLDITMLLTIMLMKKLLLSKMMMTYEMMKIRKKKKIFNIRYDLSRCYVLLKNYQKTELKTFPLPIITAFGTGTPITDPSAIKAAS